MTQSRSPTVSTLPATDIELVLAAGGIKGFEHIGVLKEFVPAQHIIKLRVRDEVVFLSILFASARSSSRVGN